MKIYKGKKRNQGIGGQYVTVNNKRLHDCCEVYNHSFGELNWGYGGSGAAQLALAILVDYFENDTSRALSLYQDFKWDFVSKFGDEWQLTSDDIERWLIKGGS